MLKRLLQIRQRASLFFLLLWTSPSVFADTADAMPWEGPLSLIMHSISGPVAKACGVVAIVLAGLGIAFGESGSGVRRLFQVVLGLAIAFSAATMVSSLFTASSGTPL